VHRVSVRAPFALTTASNPGRHVRSKFAPSDCLDGQRACLPDRARTHSVHMDSPGRASLTWSPGSGDEYSEWGRERTCRPTMSNGAHGIPWRSNT
jgi:hypothetical protein